MGSTRCTRPTGGRSPSQGSRNATGQSEGEDNFESVSIWLADLQTGESKPLTPWRDDVFLFPASFSPDGSRLAISRRIADKASEAAEIGLDRRPADQSSRPERIRTDLLPRRPIDRLLRGALKEVTRHTSRGGRLRLSARLTDILVRKASGGGLRRVTHTERAVEEAPRWDPSGQRLAYTDSRVLQLRQGVRLRQELVGYEFGKSVQVINADGTCPTTILSGLDSIHFARHGNPEAGARRGRSAADLRRNGRPQLSVDIRRVHTPPDRARLPNTSPRLPAGVRWILLVSEMRIAAPPRGRASHLIALTGRYLNFRVTQLTEA